MTDLTITQSTTSETVTLAVLSKLYDVVSNLGEGHAHINGTITTQSAYKDDINYLTTRFNGGDEGKLNINVNQWYIKFASPTLQEFLATKIGDGIGVTETAAAIAQIGGYNNGWWNQWSNKNVSCTFNEFKYFTSSLANIGLWKFREWGGLTEIDVTGATVIGPFAFQYCSNLTTIHGTESIVELKNTPFEGITTSLTGITQQNFPSLTKIGDNCFKNLTGCTGYWDLTNFESIGTTPFYNSNITGIKVNWSQLLNLSDKTPWLACDNLNVVDSDFENWTQFPLFLGCGHLSIFVMHLPLLTTIPNIGIAGVEVYNNGRDHSIAFPGQIYCPNITNGVNSNMFNFGSTNFNSLFSSSRSGGSVGLFYLKAATVLDYCIFSYTTGNFVINNITPPQIAYHTRYSDTVSEYKTGFNLITSGSRIYVPDLAVNDYKTAWSDNASIIYGISTLNNGIIYATETDWKAVGKPTGLIAEYLGLNSSELALFVSDNDLTYYSAS